MVSFSLTRAPAHLSVDLAVDAFGQRGVRREVLEVLLGEGEADDLRRVLREDDYSDRVQLDVHVLVVKRVRVGSGWRGTCWRSSRARSPPGRATKIGLIVNRARTPLFRWGEGNLTLNT